MSGGADQGPLLNRVSMAHYAIAVVFVLLRFFTRGFVVKKFGLDDLFILIAVVCFTGFCYILNELTAPKTLGLAQTATIILQVKHGRGRHSSELHEEDFNLMLMYKWINMLVYFVVNWAVKMSILALYHRIGSGKRSLPWIVQTRAIWVTAGFISAFTLAVILVQIFSCIPVVAAWEVQQIPTMCIDSVTFVRVQGAINVFTDVVLLLYPLPLLPLLKFNKRQRTALIIIFSIGLIPVVASTMRLCEIFMSGTPTHSDLTWQQTDSSWTWAWIPVWSQIEVDIGILTACLPCLSPLLRLMWNEVSVPRMMTPSMVELPKYSGSWDSMDSQESTNMKSVKAHPMNEKSGAKTSTIREKELPAVPGIGGKEDAKISNSSFYEDASDEEEAREVNPARTSDRKALYNRKMS